MVTTTRKSRTAAVLLTAQVAVIREAAHQLQGAGQDGTASRLRTAFPVAFPEDAGPLFGSAESAPLDEDSPWMADDTAAASSHPVPFPGREDLAETHPRVQAFHRSTVAPSGPPIVGLEPKWQLDCLFERWRYRQGEVDYGRWQKAVRPALQVYTFHDLWNAIEAFTEMQNASGTRSAANRLSLFLDALPSYVREGQIPYKNDVGDLTTRGRRLVGDAVTAGAGVRGGRGFW